MILYLKRTIDFDEIESVLTLEEEKITNEQMLRILFDEIKEIKIKGIPNNINNNEHLNDFITKNENNVKNLEEKINNLIKEKNEMKNEIKELKEENENIKKVLNKYKDFMDERILEIEKEKEKNKKIEEEKQNFINQNINVEFKEDPQNLKYNETLTKVNKCYQYYFDVFIGLTDHLEYIIYANNSNNIDIMRINDKTIIKSLEGHKGRIFFIKYFCKNNKEDYILSSDENSFVIIWDIQNYFSKKFTIKYTNGRLFHSLILFNVFQNDYIILPSYETKNFSKLYEFKENTTFVKNIYGTNNHCIYFIIHWFYNNKHYIIDFADKVISINNIFEDENYANLSMEPEGSHQYGCLYKNNFLCVSCQSNKFLRVWDLVNKTVYKQINYDCKYN